MQMRSLINLVENAGRRTASYPLASRDEWYANANFSSHGGKMVMMTPDRYLASVRPLVIDDISRENIDDLKAHIEAGRTLDPLTIYADGKEDGRHRAHAAKELGIKEVPVIVFERAEREHVGEAVETVYTKGYGKVIVFRNPSVADLLRAALRKDMRGLVDRNGDAYWWPASAAIHAAVAPALGLPSEDIYKRDGISRTMIRGKVLDLISGWRTAIRSREIRMLFDNGVRLKLGKDTLTLDEFVAQLEAVDRLNA